MTSKTINKKAEIEAIDEIRKIHKLEIIFTANKELLNAVDSDETFQPIDLIAIRKGSAYRVKAVSSNIYYFIPDEVDRICDWQEKHNMSVFYIIKFLSDTKPAWWITPVERNLKTKKMVLTDKGMELEEVEGRK